MAKAPADIRSLARAHGLTAIRVLAEIMADPSAPPSVRAQAATQILNRGFGALVPEHTRFIPDNREYYVYSIHRYGRLVYVGKGHGRRSFSSARRLRGAARIRAVFSSEKQALDFERRLIKRFKPSENVVHNPYRKPPENRSITGHG